MNEELSYRHELKYEIDSYQLEILRMRLSPIMYSDTHADKTGSYVVRSVYFDDLMNSCYYDNEDGYNSRKKYRIRTYNNSDSVIHLEVKHTLDEVKRLLAVIEQKAPINYKLYYHLLAYCGMRRGEALGIEYKDIDFDDSVLKLRRTSNYHVGFGVYTDTLKNDPSYRTLYLHPKLIEMIKQLKAEQKILAEKCGDQWHESDRLFVNWCGKPANPNYLYVWLRKFCEKENLPFHGLHAFRHFVATQALANGVDVKSVSTMLGHSQTSTTLNIYTHAVQPSNEKALNTVANLLETP